MITNPSVLRSVCRGCGKEGDVALQTPEPGKRLVGVRPDWCECRPPKRGGPYEAPKGYVAKFTFCHER